MLKTLSLVFGAVFLLVGVLGFVPAFAPEHSDGMRYLLGLFMVGGVHNLVHLLTGAAGIYAGMTSEKAAQMYFRVFGTVYALVTVIGFVQGDTVLGLFHVNTADNFLHLGLALALLGAGFLVKPGTATTEA